jgi:hypothetical protein
MTDFISSYGNIIFLISYFILSVCFVLSFIMMDKTIKIYGTIISGLAERVRKIESKTEKLESLSILNSKTISVILNAQHDQQDVS